MNKHNNSTQPIQTLLPFRNRFNPCRIQRNSLQRPHELLSDQYQFEEIAPDEPKLNEQVKQVEDPSHSQLFHHNCQNLITSKTPTCPVNQDHKLQSHSVNQATLSPDPDPEEDLASLWNQIQDDQKGVSKPQPNQFNPVVTTETNSCSSFELTEEELQILMQANHKPSVATPSSDKLRQSNRSNCIYHAEIPQIGQIPQKILMDSNEDENWGSWEDIAKQLESIKIQQTYEPYNNQNLICVAKNADDYACNQHKSSDQLQQNKNSSENFDFGTNLLKNYQTKNNLELCQKYGPWILKNEVYEIYEQNKVVYIQDLPIQDQKHQLSKEKFNNHRENYEASRALRKINWQIYEEKKPEIRALKSKRNCRMTLMEHGKDFFIFDQVKFSVSPIREGTHAYFGIKSFGDFGSSSQKEKQNFDSLSSREILKDYLYLPMNGQCLLETNYEGLGVEAKENKIKKFSINLCMTKEKLATCERFVYDENKQKREVIEVKFFDSFENSSSEYLGIIESKISNFSEQWYCDTIIYIPKTKVHSNKVQQKNWEKFKIQLRLSETGSIVAELGIFDAESSVTNCILFGESKTSQFMMGTLLENSHQINYILRIAGISPLLGFVAALSRKIFVISS